MIFITHYYEAHIFEIIIESPVISLLITLNKLHRHFPLNHLTFNWSIFAVYKANGSRFTTQTFETMSHRDSVTHCSHET